MKVDSANVSNFQLLSTTQQQNRQVQSVFSEVLEAAGRKGYASAQEVESEQSLEERLQSSWSEWFRVEGSGRYSEVGQTEQLQHVYGEILARAHTEGGYIQPKEFLNRLTESELQTVQKVHHLAAPIGVDSLAEEGALNLLLPPAAQVDLNHDGLTQSGIAYGMKFPDSNTPTEVALAWDEATAGMSFKERMIYEFHMVTPILMANFHFDENGVYTHHFEPGDPEFINPRADPNYSYIQETQNRLDELDFMKGQITQEQYARQTEFWNRLQDSLDKKGAR